METLAYINGVVLGFVGAVFFICPMAWHYGVERGKKCGGLR